MALTFWSGALRNRRRKPSKLFFALAGLGAAYASSDETAQIHERVTALMGQRYVDWLPSYAGHHFLLVMLAVALLLVICQLLADDLLSLWNEHRRVLILAILRVGIGLTGGMGVEMLGYKVFAGHTESVWYKLEVAIEEFMEMLGASLVLVAALKLRFQRVGFTSMQSIQLVKEVPKLSLARADHNAS